MKNLKYIYISKFKIYQTVSVVVIITDVVAVEVAVKLALAFTVKLFAAVIEYAVVVVVNLIDASIVVKFIGASVFANAVGASVLLNSVGSTFIGASGVSFIGASIIVDKSIGAVVASISISSPLTVCSTSDVMIFSGVVSEYELDFETIFPSCTGNGDVAKVALVGLRCFLARFKHDFFPQHFTTFKRRIRFIFTFAVRVTNLI